MDAMACEDFCGNECVTFDGTTCYCSDCAVTGSCAFDYGSFTGVYAGWEAVTGYDRICDAYSYRYPYANSVYSNTASYSYACSYSGGNTAGIICNCELFVGYGYWACFR